MALSESDPEGAACVRGLRRGLQELRWEEGINLQIVVRWASRSTQEFALRLKLPSIYIDRSFPHAGGLMSYGPDFDSIWNRAATYVDRILKGEKPANLPVEQPTKFDLVINLRTAKALGLGVPQSLLVAADETIE